MRAGGLPQLLEHGLVSARGTWLDDRWFLVVGDRRRPVVIDTVDGSVRDVEGPGGGCYPRICVTGRFDPAQLEPA